MLVNGTVPRRPVGKQSKKTKGETVRNVHFATLLANESFANKGPKRALQTYQPLLAYYWHINPTISQRFPQAENDDDLLVLLGLFSTALNSSHRLRHNRIFVVFTRVWTKIF